MCFSDLFSASVRVVAVPRISTSSRNLGNNDGVFPSNFGVLALPRRGICAGRAIGAGGSGAGNTAGYGRTTRDGGQACWQSGVLRLTRVEANVDSKIGEGTRVLEGLLQRT